jgi:hypothetical protein
LNTAFLLEIKKLFGITKQTGLEPMQVLLSNQTALFELFAYWHLNSL